MNSYQFIYERKQEIQQRIRKLKRELRGKPSETLHVLRNRNSWTWYIKKNGTSASSYVHLPRTERKMAENYAYVTFLRSQLADLEEEAFACEKYMSVFTKGKKLPDHLISREEKLWQNIGFKELLLSHFPSRTQDWIKWSQEDYPNGHDHYPNQLNVKVNNQLYVRSKSERSIALIFDRLHIPYRYEWKIEYGTIWILPDFTAPNLRTGELIYLEHVGKTDDPGYMKEFGAKLSSYSRLGIYPEVNLVATFENPDFPLDLDETEAKIRRFFL